MYRCRTIAGKQLLLWSFTAALILVNGPAGYAQAKIGYIDSQKIMKSYSGVADAEEKLRDENRKWESELGTMKDELRKEKADLDDLSLLLSETRKKEKEGKITELEQQIEAFQKRVWGDNGEYMRKQESLLKPVYEDIKRAVDSISEEDGFDIIFDTVQGNIVFAREQLDITERVIELLKENEAATDTEQRR
ncbi:OmpH family outer membrane protein [bacterium]|nr:OmpH family outer membrane protein [bacterium]